MPTILGFKTHSDANAKRTATSSESLYLPYDLRTELSWVDFSGTNNPLGTPQSFLAAMHSSLVDGELMYTPDREANKLRSILARRYELKPESFVCGTTTSEMIRAAAQVFNPGIVGISVPAPSDYFKAIANAGHEVVELPNPYSFVVPDFFTARQGGVRFDAVLLANPTYPTSRLLSKNILIHYLENCQWVIVDESLIELTLGGESMVDLTQTYRNLIVVRSFSNSFAMPGVPISYCVAHPDTIERIRHYCDSSNVSMFCEVLADISVQEEDHIENARELLEAEIPWMQCMLNLIPGIQILPAEANFVMCSYECPDSLNLAVADSDELISRLQLAGFLVKKLEGMPGISGDKYFCVSVRTRADNERFLKALRDIILPK